MNITQESSFETTTEESRNECHVGTEQVLGKEGGRKKRKLETAGTAPKLAPAQTEGKAGTGRGLGH